MIITDTDLNISTIGENANDIDFRATEIIVKANAPATIEPADKNDANPNAPIPFAILNKSTSCNSLSDCVVSLKAEEIVVTAPDNVVNVLLNISKNDVIG